MAGGPGLASRLVPRQDVANQGGDLWHLVDTSSAEPMTALTQSHRAATDRTGHLQC